MTGVLAQLGDLLPSYAKLAAVVLVAAIPLGIAAYFMWRKPRDPRR
jgi:hypothetical protein